jgi:hypothetical protein
MRRFAISASIAVALVAAALAVPAAASAVTPAPSVSTISPAVGRTAGGTTVTITGKGFTDVQYVEFGATKGTKLAVASSKKLTVVSPAHTPGVIDVRIVTSAGTSSQTANDYFDYVGVPTVDSTAPLFGPLAGGTVVTVHGTNFVAVSEVLFGSMKGTKVNVVSSTKLTVIAPKHASGQVRVRVVAGFGDSSAKGSAVYQFAPAAAKLSGAGYVVASSTDAGTLNFTTPSFKCPTTDSWQVDVGINTQQVLAADSDGWGANVDFGCTKGSAFSSARLLAEGGSMVISHPHSGDQIQLFFGRESVGLQDDGSNSGSGAEALTSGIDRNTPNIAYLVDWTGSVPSSIASLKFVAIGAGKPLAKSHPVTQSESLSTTSSLVPSTFGANGKTFTVAPRAKQD